MSELNMSSTGERPTSSSSKDKPARNVEKQPFGTAAIKHQSTASSFGSGLGGAGKMEFTRATNLNGTGATRCKLFHSKIADAPLKVMEANINKWLDSEVIEVKSTDTCIGTMQDKSSEPNIIVMIWY